MTSDSGEKPSTSAGLEPATFGAENRRAIRCATRPLPPRSHHVPLPSTSAGDFEHGNGVRNLSGRL
eukprot:CAMPEP_0174907562 /NCGR_PEP_ID=MMETSP0167-20121228/61276_1 /TAXON_ID=38298 /ORGANISM="Rhodella maculata, Strain CCMP736" /LENGTH=65 /DNA_ID=CAMNT_0016151069 /DNA_START=51 /DNA_END=245 /DNA_ORIENTATION=-